MWFYKGKEFNNDINEYDSFVYLITRLADDEDYPKFYIGKKTFWFTQRKKIKGKSRRSVIKRESDWVEYFGSSDWLNEIIKKEGKEHFRREIIHLCKSKGESFVLEAKEQLSNNALSKRFFNGTKMFYNKNILGKYTKDYFSESELTELMSIDNSMNNTGKIWITNGTESKQINLTELIPDNWEKGYHYGINYCWVNNGKIDKKIPRSDINSLEFREWNVGRLYCPTKNKICVSKLDNIKYIKETEVNAYINNGWTRGNTKFQTLKERNKIYVCDDNTKTQKLVFRNEIKKFLNDNVGWRIGQFTRGNFGTENKVFAINMVTGEKIQVTKEDYANNDNLTSLRTKKIKVKKKNRIVFKGFLPMFFKEFDVPETPFRKALREGTPNIIVKKGKNKFLTDEKWHIIEI